MKLDIRDIAALRHAADVIERDYGRIDAVVANAAIQCWMPLLEMQSDDISPAAVFLASDGANRVTGAELR